MLDFITLICLRIFIRQCNKYARLCQINMHLLNFITANVIYYIPITTKIFKEKQPNLYCLQEREVIKILELDSAIVQIALSPMNADNETKLLISSETRTIICDSVQQTFVEIGNQTR